MQALRCVVAWFVALGERCAAIDQLASMSDRELADIGLSRYEIHSVFKRSFGRERNRSFEYGTLSTRA